MIRKQLIFKQTSVDEKNYTIYGIFSTDDEDRHGEIVDQSGWILDQFNANPVILFAHDHYQPAVGQGVEVKIQDIGGKKQLAGGIKFAAEEYDFAMTLFKLYAGRYMRAFSVGFMNNVYEIDQESDTIILKENVLYEISCVNVPANAMALANSKGVDVQPIEELMNKRKLGKLAEPEKKSETEKPEEENKEPEKPAEELEPEEELEKAVEQISQGNPKTIRSAIRTLTGVLNAKSEADNQDGKGRNPADAGGEKKIPVTLINRAVRELLKIKKGL